MGRVIAIETGTIRQFWLPSLMNSHRKSDYLLNLDLRGAENPPCQPQLGPKRC